WRWLSFGFPVGFVADSLGATIGTTTIFLLGRTEKELIEMHHVWLNEELTAKIDDIFQLRRTHIDLETDISAKLQNVITLFPVILIGHTEFCSSKDAAAANEEHLSAEIFTYKLVSPRVSYHLLSPGKWKSRCNAKCDDVSKPAEIIIQKVCTWVKNLSYMFHRVVYSTSTQTTFKGFIANFMSNLPNNNNNNNIYGRNNNENNTLPVPQYVFFIANSLSTPEDNHNNINVANRMGEKHVPKSLSDIEREKRRSGNPEAMEDDIEDEVSKIIAAHFEESMKFARRTSREFGSEFQFAEAGAGSAAASDAFAAPAAAVEEDDLYS
ncbi:hypothetical protein GIB67_016525, partial [Kingdonia uniflora]